MRPRRTILLAGENEEKLQITRYLLGLNYFTVQLSTRADEALSRLRKQHYDVLIVDMPLAGAAILIEAAGVIDRRAKILLLAERGMGLGAVGTADVTLWPEGCTSKALLDWVRILARGRRGPRGKRKPMVRPTLFDEAMKRLAE